MPDSLSTSCSLHCTSMYLFSTLDISTKYSCIALLKTPAPMRILPATIQEKRLDPFATATHAHPAQLGAHSAISAPRRPHRVDITPIKGDINTWPMLLRLAEKNIYYFSVLEPCTKLCSYHLRKLPSS